MRIRIVSYAAVAISAAAIFLSACSGASQSGPGGLPPAVGMGNAARMTSAAAHRAQPSRLLRTIYVNDFSQNAVYVQKYRTWQNIGTITNGVNRPGGSWVDPAGNLYVANGFGTENVTEYDPSGNLVFTYDSGTTAPTAVTTDRFGVVYEADGFGSVNEYGQQSNYVAATCSPGGSSDGVVGVALDKRGDVFALYGDPHSTFNNIIEYPHGLLRSRCVGTVLPMTLLEATSIVVDPQGKLVVAVAGSHAVDIIAPPYTAVTGALGSGWSAPVSATIDKAGTQAYVTDQGTQTVTVLTYPGGSNVATIGSADGLSNPTYAIDSKNFVP